MALRNALLKSRRTLGAIVATILLVTASLFTTATPASAGHHLGSCVGPFWGYYDPADVCMNGDTGDKDPANHREWIERVNVSHKYPPRKVELWGDGFYYSTHGTSLEVNVRKWVRDDTYICGAATPNSGPRAIVCWHIDV